MPAKDLPELLRACSDFQNLKIKGWTKKPLTDLSMGMSHDYFIAIECGATYVRVGTAIFGDRLSS